MSDAIAIFVSPAGSNTTGDGTRNKPFATINRGADEAASKGKRVYVCADAGDYNETLSVGPSNNGVEIYGGFRCSDWSWEASYHARLVAKGHPAARIAGASDITLDHLEFRGTANEVAGESAFGVWIQDSKGVEIRDSLASAGRGQDGSAGVAGVKGEDGQVAGKEQEGVDLAASTNPGLGGSWAAPSACGSKGGDGGTANTTATVPGGNGIPNTDVTPAMLDNGGTTGNGAAGSPGDAGNHGSASTAGVLTDTGYTPGDGHDGSPGHTGQGGGGGAGRKRPYPGIALKGGGAGGMGGCGGEAGTKGTGGGASIALVSWDSELTLTRVQLETLGGGNGGAGGNGGLGGLGQAGANGNYYPTLEDADGGKGGDGGKAGAGSGGSGGLSLGLAIHGSVPVQSDVSITPGAGGTAGPGGYTGEATDKAPDGQPGESLERLVL